MTDRQAIARPPARQAMATALQSRPALVQTPGPVLPFGLSRVAPYAGIPATPPVQRITYKESEKVPPVSEVDEYIRSVLEGIYEKIQSDFKEKDSPKYAIPKHFEVMAGGSYARDELTASSDLDVFVLVPEEESEEEFEKPPDYNAFAQALGNALKDSLMKEYNTAVDVEGSGTLRSIVRLDQRGGGTQRTFRTVHSTKGEDSPLADELFEQLSQNKTIRSDALNELADAGTGKFDNVKNSYYRPLQRYVNILFQVMAERYPKLKRLPTPNSIARLEAIGEVDPDPFYGQVIEAYRLVNQYREEPERKVKPPKQLIQVLTRLEPHLQRKIKGEESKEELLFEEDSEKEKGLELKPKGTTKKEKKGCKFCVVQ